MRRKVGALAAIQRALAKEPKQFRFRMTEGRVYQSSNDQESASRSFLLADQLQPRSPDTFLCPGHEFLFLNAV